MALETNEYLSMFIDESKDHLQALNENLMNLENNPDDISIVQNIFRSAHTLKGMSATMAFDDIASLTHEMESVLDLIRNQKLQMNDQIIDSLFKSLDALESMVEDIIAGGTGKADVSDIVSILEGIVSGDSPQQEASFDQMSSVELDQYQYSILTQSIESKHRVFYVEVTVSEACVLKAARAYMVFDLLERNGEVVKSTPSVEDIEQEKFDQKFSVFYISNVEETDLNKMIANVSEIEAVQIVTIDQDSLTQMNPSLKNQTNEEVTTAAAPAPSEPKQNNAPKTNIPVSNRTIRVDIERLDTLMNLFSELLIDRVRLEVLAGEIKRSELTDTVEHMTRVSTDLQNIVLKLRMVPVESVFNRFPRMVRDLARNLDKKVELVISGADTELDRTVIDEIGDPLVHLIRNALDHGIESVQDRKLAGKPETGTIDLRAYHSGNHVFIEIEEDGRGINREKVVNTAVKRSVVTLEEANMLTDEEVYQLLFAPGFSTADTISDVSGRGVGLDVVKSKINSLGGEVKIQSQEGVGTQFSVQLPLTLSIISAMLIRLGNESYAVPLSSIVETAILHTDKIHTVHGTEMIDFRDQLIPIISLKKILDCPVVDVEEITESDIVVIRKGDKLAAFMVDELIGQQEIVLKSLGDYLSNTFAVSGATILGDGQVALIIDTNALVK